MLQNPRAGFNSDFWKMDGLACLSNELLPYGGQWIFPLYIEDPLVVGAGQEAPASSALPLWTSFDPCSSTSCRLLRGESSAVRVVKTQYFLFLVLPK